MTPKNILIVDDNKDLADALSELLSDEGCHVKTTYNGNSAYHEFRTNKFDAIFLDAKLPDYTGVQLSHLFWTENPSMSIVLMTGHRIQQILQQSTNGMTSVIQHPYGVDELLELMTKAGRSDVFLMLTDDENASAKISSFLDRIARKHFVIRDEKQLDNLSLSYTPDWIIIDSLANVLRSLHVYLNLTDRQMRFPTIIICRADSPIDKLDVEALFSLTGCLLKPFDMDFFLNIVRQSNN